MKHSWREKLDREGLKVVEASAKLRSIRPPSSLDFGDLNRWVKEQKTVFESLPDLGKKRKVKLTNEFLRFLLRAHPDIELNEQEFSRMFDIEELPKLRADELELHQRIFLALESNQERRFEVYGLAASGIILIRRLFSGSLKKQLGTKIPTLPQVIAAIAQNLEWLGRALRGGRMQPPGRVNVELAELVDVISEHQERPLTQLELYEAVMAAGGQVPEDPEAFRLWLHRARKQGLVKKFRSRRSKESRKAER